MRDHNTNQMKNLILIIVMLFGITLQSDAQSHKHIKLLNDILSIDMPTSTITGSNGTLIINLSIRDIAVIIMTNPEEVAREIKNHPFKAGERFLQGLVNNLNDNYYKMGIRTINLYFITTEGTRIYGGAVKVNKPKINFKA